MKRFWSTIGAATPTFLAATSGWQLHSANNAFEYVVPTIVIALFATADILRVHDEHKKGKQ